MRIAGNQTLGVTQQLGQFNTKILAGHMRRGSTVRVKRAPTKRLATSIAMYMCRQSVQVTYGGQYQDTQIGAVTESALNAFNDFVLVRLEGG